MDHFEIPLVLFTIMGQWAVGTALILAMADLFLVKYSPDKHQGLRIGGMLVLPLCALAIIFSIFHLGQPLTAYKALGNLGTSWLSREILAFVFLGISALAYSYVWWKNPEKESARKGLGVVTGIIGLVAVVISANVYTLPAHATWNNWQTTASFLLSAFFLGSLTILALLSAYNKEVNLKARKTLAGVTIISLVGLVITLAAFAGGYGASSEQTAAVGLVVSSSLFWFRILCGLVVPGALAFSLLGGVKEISKGLTVSVLLIAVLGELSGRALFYYSVMAQQPWF